MKRLYANLTSNAGLILLAMLTLGIWTSNLLSFYQQRSKPVLTVETQAAASDNRRVMAQDFDPDKFMERRRKTAPSPATAGDFDPDAFMAGRRQKPGRPQPSAEAELGQKFKAQYPGAYDDLTDDELGRKVKAKYPGATAICNDNTASYSQTRSGTCSYHGGVKVWLINAP